MVKALVIGVVGRRTADQTSRRTCCDPRAVAV